MMRGHQWMSLLALAGLCACSAEETPAVSAEALGSFAGAADATAIELADLGGSAADVLLLVPERKVLEVFAVDGATYSNVASPFIGGSEFVGDGTPVKTMTANLVVNGQTKSVVLTQLGGTLITMVVPGNEPHLLEYPVRVYHRQYGDIHDFSVADVDGDGSDELLVGESYGVGVVDLIPSLSVLPESPVDQSTSTTRLDSARGAGAIAASDVDGDGVKDVITLDPAGSVLHVYMGGNQNFVEQFLPSMGAQAIPSSCEQVSAFLRLADGTFVRLSRESVPEQLVIGNTDKLASSGDYVLTANFANGEVEVFDHCGKELGVVDTGGVALTDMALFGNTLAVFDIDKSVKLFKLAAEE
jgi:hypothetical protein